jgi:hypothetical protein
MKEPETMYIRKKITLEELLKDMQDQPYNDQYVHIVKMIESGALEPIKASPLNGKNPPLKTRYYQIEEDKDYSELLDELKFSISSKINIDYYLSHPGVYDEEKEYVRALSRYLNKLKVQSGGEQAVSLNERSFEIWGREKFLQRENGTTILKHCKISVNDLNIYKTSEPVSYYSHNKVTPQNLIIIENKDTFFSMRKYLIEGGTDILGISAGTLIYGAGKGVIRSFEDYETSVEPYMTDSANTFLYFGDLDYEGIGIYERLAESMRDRISIVPFVSAYCRMLEKASERGINFLPDTKEGQNKAVSGIFYSFFNSDMVAEMKSILESDKYIPQEILNISDFRIT